MLIDAINALIKVLRQCAIDGCSVINACKVIYRRFCFFCRHEVRLYFSWNCVEMVEFEVVEATPVGRCYRRKIPF